MSFPLFLMLAAIVLKLGRIADHVDPLTPPDEPFKRMTWLMSWIVPEPLYRHSDLVGWPAVKDVFRKTLLPALILPMLILGVLMVVAAVDSLLR
jgi:hypothetical protein